MRQLRRRVARRRRRRVAATVAAAAAAASAAGLVTVMHPLAAGPRDDRPAPPAAPPSPGAEVRYPNLIGLTLELPSGWSGVTAPESTLANALGYVANQPLSKVACAKKLATGYSCAPLITLDRGGALIVFSLSKENNRTAKNAFGPLAAKDIAADCRASNGDYELMAWRTIPNYVPQLTVTATVCLNRASAETLAQVRSLLRTVEFGGSAPTAPEAGVTYLRVSQLPTKS